MSSKKSWPAWAWLLVIAGLAVVVVLVWWLNRAPVNMDELSRDGMYHYRNQDLNFNLDLPEQFIYYQTERTNSADYKEIKFYIPTSDPDYTNETPASYARAIVVRVYQEAAWNKLSAGDESKRDFQKVATKDGQVYLIWFWDHQPKDWQDKWTEAMKQSISQSLK